ncbi:MAG: lamin tail domain-containing protein [Methanobacteriota archaeon]|nr:MAG: lamin tail domain-containing protein [Euryarchaeota archaeon]
MRRSNIENGQGSEPPVGSRGFTNGLRESKLDPRRDQGARRSSGRADSLTNGLTNGRTNGVVNGFVNGLTNGLTNGSGQTNGLRVSFQHRRVVVSFASVRTRVAVVAVLCILILSLPYALVYTFPPDEVEVDGYFLDWLDAQIFKDSPDALNPDVAIAEYAMKAGSSESYFYIRTAGEVLHGAGGGVDGFYVFIDIDGSPSTGYALRGLGADSLVVVVGWNNSVRLSELYVYDDRSGGEDYAGFLLSGVPLVGHRGDRMEIGADIALDLQSRAALCTRHTNASEDWSEVNFGVEGPAVRVAEAHPAAPVTLGNTDELMLSLRLTVKGPSVALEGLRFEALGNATASELEAVESCRSLGVGSADLIEFDDQLVLHEGRAATIDILASFSSNHVGDTYGLRLDRAFGLLVDGDVFVTFDAVSAGSLVVHIASVSEGVVIDGGFADWHVVPRKPDWVGDVVSPANETLTNSDVDITATSATSEGERAYFYMAVDGTMLAGSNVPGELRRWTDDAPVPGDGIPGGEPQAKLGANFAYIFLDTDYDHGTGYSIGGAEAAIVIVGKENRILSSRAYEYVGDEWYDVGEVSAAVDGYQLETGADLGVLGLSPDSDYAAVFLSQDWRGCEDSAVSFLLSESMHGIREFGGVIINEVFSSVPGQPDDWFELYNTGTETVDIGGWEMWVNDVLRYTFPEGTTIDPGEILLVSNIDIGRATSFVLIDDSSPSVIVDSIMLPFWKAETYGRTGTPADEYSTWDWMDPTPGDINIGQVPIPEFGSVVLPVAAITIMFLVVTQRRRRAGKRRSTDSE